MFRSHGAKLRNHLSVLGARGAPHSPAGLLHSVSHRCTAADASFSEPVSLLLCQRPRCSWTRPRAIHPLCDCRAILAAQIMISLALGPGVHSVPVTVLTQSDLPLSLRTVELPQVESAAVQPWHRQIPAGPSSRRLTSALIYVVLLDLIWLSQTSPRCRNDKNSVMVPGSSGSFPDYHVLGAG